MQILRAPTLLFLSVAAAAVPPELGMVGVDLAVAEFGQAPGVLGKDCSYPGAKQFDYCRDKGLTMVRLPFRWERVQDEPLGPLDPEDMGRPDASGCARRA